VKASLHVQAAVSFTCVNLCTLASQPGCQSLLSTEVASAVRTQEASFDTSHLWSEMCVVSPPRCRRFRQQYNSGL